MSARLTAEEHRLRAILETPFMHEVIRFAVAQGWKVHHSPKAGVRRDGSVRSTPGVTKGFPDLVLVREDRLVFLEMKRETGRVKPEQEQWLADLAKTHAETMVVRPSNLPELRRVLAKEDNR